MKQSELRQIIREELEKTVRGLYKAKVGDSIWIGKEGMSYKDRSTIAKILPDGKLVDKRGNIFLPNGMLFRGADINFKKKFNPGKQVSAQIATQEDFDKEYKQVKVDHLRKFNWEKMNIEDLEKIIDQLPVKQGNTLNISRFTKK